MRRSFIITTLVSVVSVAAVSAAAWDFRPDKAIRVGTGLTAETLCTDVFISGLDPATVFAQAIKARPGVGRLARHITYRVDTERRAVSAAYLGHFASTAVYRAGEGCLLIQDDAAPPATARPAGARAPQRLADIAGPDLVEPANPGLKAALDHIFTDRPGAPPRWLRAVVVLKDGKVVAERYAPGIGVDTPLIGYSASKSVISSLVGVLVRQGRLDIHAPAPVAAWRAAGDPRHAITTDTLLRMTSGLDIAQTGSGFDPASRMLFTERDMAGYAEAHRLARPVGARWDYSDASTLIVSRIVRDAAGGDDASVQAFARRELFDPLGMKTAILTTDATGTPVGSTGILASARDWAKLGELYARDGVVGGQRILPEGWVQYSATSTLGTSYGAGFWTNRSTDPDARGRVRGGMPCDMLYASGVLGQRVYIVPSADVVIVRFGVTQKWPDFDIEGDKRLVREVLAALPAAPAPARARSN
jgi:CubicO group peptidase (beta-lactamase class C family)